MSSPVCDFNFNSNGYISRSQKLKREMLEEIENKRHKVWKLNKTKSVNKSVISHKSLIEINNESVNGVVEDTYQAPGSQLATTPKRTVPIRVVRARRLESRTLKESEFDLIGSGRPSGKLDSAGHRMNNVYTMRQQEKHRLLCALNSDDLPKGALNTQALALSIEANIYKILKNDRNLYQQQCCLCVDYIIDDKNKQLKNDLLMGRLEPQVFAFMPEKDSDWSRIITSRIKWKAIEDKSMKEKLTKWISS